MYQAYTAEHERYDKAQHAALLALCKCVGSAKKRPDLTDQDVLAELGQLATLPLEHCLRVRHALIAKTKALELLGRHLKLFVDVVETHDEETITARLERALIRIATPPARIAVTAPHN